jgi:hypothetical protein
MKKQKNLLLLLGFILAVCILPAVSAIDVTTCQTIGSSGTYVLQNDVSADGITCFDITASDVTLDMNGFMINNTNTSYNAGSSILLGWAVNLSSSASNFHIKNGTILNYPRNIILRANGADIRDMNITMLINSTQNTIKGIYSPVPINDTIIKNNYFSMGCEVPQGSPDTNIILIIQQYNYNIEVTDNIFENQKGCGTAGSNVNIALNVVFGINATISNNIVRNSYFNKASNGGIFEGVVNNSIVLNNTIRDMFNQTIAFRLSGYNNYINGLTIINGSAINTGQSGIVSLNAPYMNNTINNVYIDNVNNVGTRGILAGASPSGNISAIISNLTAENFGTNNFTFITKALATSNYVNLTFINATYNNVEAWGAFAGNYLTRRWYYGVNVTYNNSDKPVNSANIFAYDRFGNLAFSAEVIDGRIATQYLTDYMAVSNGTEGVGSAGANYTYYSPYNVTAVRRASISSHLVNMTSEPNSDRNNLSDIFVLEYLETDKEVFRDDTINALAMASIIIGLLVIVIVMEFLIMKFVMKDNELGAGVSGDFVKTISIIVGALISIGVAIWVVSELLA